MYLLFCKSVIKTDKWYLLNTYVDAKGAARMKSQLHHPSVGGRYQIRKIIK